MVKFKAPPAKVFPGIRESAFRVYGWSPIDDNNKTAGEFWSGVSPQISDQFLLRNYFKPEPTW